MPEISNDPRPVTGPFARLAIPITIRIGAYIEYCPTGVAMKLHIGSRKRTEGWKTLDITPGPEVDFTGDCRNLSNFADGSVEIIYASHVLEHVPYNYEMMKTLKEWFRVLKPGGTVMISVPDLETLCRLFVHPQITPKNRYTIMRMMFGGQVDTHDFHCAGLDWNIMGTFLHEAGFTEIKRVSDFGLFQDTSELKYGGVPISLNVTARKPDGSQSEQQDA